MSGVILTSAINMQPDESSERYAMGFRGIPEFMRTATAMLAFSIVSELPRIQAQTQAESLTPTESRTPSDSRTQSDSRAQSVPQFNRDIRPILSNHCFQCHGPDQRSRQGGLRLDLRESATSPAESGRPAIEPGHPERSALIERIQSHDSDLLMPPAETGKPLTPFQQQQLVDWISAGAIYEQHWAFLPIVRPEVPQPVQRDWIRNEIDHFVLSRLEHEGLISAPSAEPERLIRRLSLDLTGLPPSRASVNQFVQAAELAAASAESYDAAWSRLIDQLLKSPHYGERMAVDWLDAARFADTNGYQVDRDREMWAWRDWVIQAFNSNQPFDQFTIEQIAGDLLPQATLQQQVATGFHRNHMMNEEGGVIPEEFLAEYCADRVETTATVWLGQTFNCCRCHDHKFDPFTQRDFYGLYAFFHNVSESGLGNYGANIRRNAPPFVKLPAPEIEQQLAALRTEQQAAADSLKILEDSLPADVLVIVKKDAAARTAVEQKQLTEQFSAKHEELQKLTKRIAELPGIIEKLDLQIPTTLVMQELPAPRVTTILMRGVYNKPGDVVTAATPAILPAMATDLPRNRLGLARWLTDPCNPLPARVTMNRMWQSLFGTGLVRTAEDFGIQGEAPSHPELLDWLAAEFISSGWDLQHMLRLMVNSATYRQSSRRTHELQERDPENRLLARGARFRLQAEFVRDQALFVSGLLVPQIGGPSVKPYHPPGLYEQVTAGSGTDVYVEGKGDELHRRSMYTYWKRSVPHPGMLAFDAPFREACTLRRPRTNTPLQALNLMNDPTYVESARLLAQRMMTEGGASQDEQLTLGFQLVLSRRPHPKELKILAAAYARVHRDFLQDPAAAEELLKVGAVVPPPAAQPATANQAVAAPTTETNTTLPTTTAADTAPAKTTEPDRIALAAMTTVASTILNLDEAIMKE